MVKMINIIEKVEKHGFFNSDVLYLSGEIDWRLGNFESAESKFIKALTYSIYSP